MIIKEINLHINRWGEYSGDGYFLCTNELHKYFDFKRMVDITLIAHNKRGKGRIKVGRRWFRRRFDDRIRVSGRFMCFSVNTKALIEVLIDEHKALYVELKERN